jgi:hypothetical protein
MRRGDIRRRYSCSIGKKFAMSSSSSFVAFTASAGADEDGTAWASTNTSGDAAPSVLQPLSYQMRGHAFFEVNVPEG